MVGGGQIGPNPETRGWIAPQQQVTDPFGQGGAYGHKRGPFQQGFGDPSKLATNATLDINYRDHYPPMEQQQAAGDGAVVDQQRGNVYKQSEWGQESDGRVVESEYQVATGRDLSVSESSQSDGSEDEEDEDDEDDDDEDDEDMVENDDDDKEGPEGVSDAQVVEGVSAVPLAHSGLEIRPDDAYPRNIAERDRATLKAVAIGTAGTSSNSPFGMFQSPSSTIPFLNSFSSPSNAAPHADGNPSQNGVVIASASAAAASYSLTRDGDLSRDNVVTRESLAVVTTTTTTTTSSLQEPSGRIVASGPPLHEQLQSTDVDNYYTTLLNTQTPPNNGLNKAAAEAASRRMADPQSTAESSLRRILSDPLTGALMDDAMIISCGHSVGNAGRRRVMETSVCIICGASVRTEAMAPNYALRMVVQAFKREEEMNGNLSLRSAKRRRDTIQESIGLPEQAAADAAKVKGVQFPFVVSDRVMIKGNKRTPERFVGREAVITTQCLNGWYLVRTLDTGESVRLQYRSLQKMGVETPSNDSEYRPS